MRTVWPALAGALLLVLGAAGLVRGELPQAAVASGPAQPGRISVTGAYVRAPVPPTQLAAGYFTVTNTTDAPDRLESVQTGAGRTAELHAVVNGVMSAVSGGVVIPAHGHLVLSTGNGHVMIGQLFDRLVAGQTVNMTLEFAKAGTIGITAPVIGIGAPVPTGATSPSTSMAPMPGMPGMPSTSPSSAAHSAPSGQ